VCVCGFFAEDVCYKVASAELEPLKCA